MTTRYVGIGGNDASDGLSWANRKLTLNGAEDTPVAAGDTVYVGPGTYRELLTCDVSGTAEAGAISYIGDYDGSHTDGVGGVVRITGSDDDDIVTRENCVTATAKAYRKFENFVFDGTSSYMIACPTSSDNFIFNKCVFMRGDNFGISFYPAPSNHTVSNCIFMGFMKDAAGAGVYIRTAAAAATTILITNCLFTGCRQGVYLMNAGSNTIKNCTFYGNYLAVIQNGGSTDYVNTINNCLIFNHYRPIQTTVAGTMVENYNAFDGNALDRVNVDVGANSTTDISLMDNRWAMELLNGGNMLSPFDLLGGAGVINIAGTSPTTADMRGTTVQGTQREWGALEYDSTLDIEAGGGLLTNPGMAGGMRG